MHKTDTLVIGAGQAGIAMSEQLSKQGIGIVLFLRFLVHLILYQKAVQPHLLGKGDKRYLLISPLLLLRLMPSCCLASVMYYG